METSALSYMTVFSREGYIKEVFHMFSFLIGRQNILVVFDPTEPYIYLYKFPREDWLETS